MKPVISCFKLKACHSGSCREARGIRTRGEEYVVSQGNRGAVISHSPIKRSWASLGFAAKHHLSAPL